MTRQMEELQIQIDQERQKGQVSSEHAEREMASTKHELLRIREMLEMAEKVRGKGYCYCYNLISNHGNCPLYPFHG